MSDNNKRLIRSRKKKRSEEVSLEQQTPIVPTQPTQNPQPIQKTPEQQQLELQRQILEQLQRQTQPDKSKRDVLFAEDTQTCSISLDDIKSGQIRVFINGAMDAQIIKLPKPLALALRMAYREGLNSGKQPQIITTKQSNEEEYVIRAAEAMADYLRRLGTCHGKVEQDLLDAVKNLKAFRSKPPDTYRQ